MATSISPLFSGNFLYVSLLLCLVFSSRQGCAFQGRKVAETHHLSDSHFTVQVASLRPSVSCKRPTTAVDNRTTLEVVHRHGPCSELNEDKAKKPHSIDETFRQDQLRVDWIHSRLSQPSGSGDAAWRTDATTLPAKSGIPLGSGNYIVTLQLGTPASQLTLVFDTGSPLTWTQCQPCAGSCYTQAEQIFDPAKSSSYSNVSCSLSVCSSLPSQGVSQGCTKSTKTCLYDVSYGDGSESVGYLSQEKLILGSSDVFNNFIFGCGQANQGLFGRTAGLIGLSRGSVSIVEQTASKYKKVFSYCLPSSTSSTGFLTFGSSSSKSAQFTTLSGSSSSFYDIGITGINVGGSQLSISSSVFSTSGAIIDSGTVITRLPPAAYSALRTTFRGMMTQYKMVQSPVSLFDTCYDFSGLSSVNVPKIRFTFSGGVNVDIPLTGTLAGVGTNTFCLAFAGNSNPSSTAIFGNKQQHTFEVIYDVGGGKLGFVPGRCS